MKETVQTVEPASLEKTGDVFNNDFKVDKNDEKTQSNLSEISGNESFKGEQLCEEHVVKDTKKILNSSNSAMETQETPHQTHSYQDASSNITDIESYEAVHSCNEEDENDQSEKTHNKQAIKPDSLPHQDALSTSKEENVEEKDAKNSHPDSCSTTNHHVIFLPSPPPSPVSSKTTRVIEYNDKNEPILIHNDENDEASFDMSPAFHEQPSCNSLPVNPLVDSENLNRQEGTIESFEKHTIFLNLYDWEKKRQTRVEEAEKILDPIVDDLFTTVQTSKDNMANLIKYFKDRVKLQREMVSKIRSTKCLQPFIIEKAKNHDGDGSTTSSAEKTIDPPDVQDGSSTIFHGASHKWINELYKSSLYEAGCLESFAEYIENDDVSESLQRCLRDYEKSTNTFLQSVNDARHRVKSHLHAILVVWNEFYKLFIKETEKDKWSAGKASHDMTETTNESNDLHNSPASESTAVVSGGRPNKDPWLFERRYIHAAVSSHQMYNAYYDVIRKTVIDMQHLENWKNNLLKTCVMNYISQFTDPQEFLSMKHIALGKTTDTHINLCDQHLSSVQPMNTLEAPKKESLEENVETATTSPYLSPSDLSYKLDNSILLPNLRTKLNSIKQLINHNYLPTSRLAIKISHVRRSTGYFGKWSEGLLVLTWDRFLHMFRSHDDMQPLWSLAVRLCEIKVIQDSSETKTIEIREKRSLLNVLGHRSYFFRSVFSGDHLSWVKCLELAEKADDYTFRSQAIHYGNITQNQE